MGNVPTHLPVCREELDIAIKKTLKKHSVSFFNRNTAIKVLQEVIRLQNTGMTDVRKVISASIRSCRVKGSKKWALYACLIGHALQARSAAAKKARKAHEEAFEHYSAQHP